jgi:uracil-DNA glycosylase
MPELVRLVSLNDFAEWRAAARALLLRGIPPEQVRWADPAEAPDLLTAHEPTPLAGVEDRRVGRVPPRFIKLAEAAICHADPSRFALLYALLWRLQKDREILFDLDDTDVGRLNRRVQAVLAEYKRMKQELRFRRAVAADGHKGLAASFTPAHYVLERVAPHFTTAIAHEDWIIATPYRSAFWVRKELTFGPGRPAGVRRR